jgi:hypothetical protein
VLEVLVVGEKLQVEPNYHINGWRINKLKLKLVRVLVFLMTLVTYFGPVFLQKRRDVLEAFLGTFST